MSKFRYWFRYYFVRKKAPLSSIFWRDILRRDATSVGMYGVSIATVDDNDGGISLSCGAPKDNTIEIVLYDKDNKLYHTETIKLSYRSMKRVMKGFDNASAVSRQKIREENSR